MVSLDDAKRNKAFADSVSADFVLLSDPTKQDSAKYGVLAEGGSYTKRWTFYIDENGVIRKIDKNVSPGSHGQEVVKTLSELGFPKRPKQMPQEQGNS